MSASNNTTNERSLNTLSYGSTAGSIGSGINSDRSANWKNSDHHPILNQQLQSLTEGEIKLRKTDL